MASKSFYYQYGYKEFILKETLDENVHLRKNNFYLNKLNIFLPIFELRESKKYSKRSKLNKVLFLYFLYQSFFDKDLRIIFKKTLGTSRKILKKKESSYQDILGFKVVLNSTEIFEFLKNFTYDFFFKSLCEKNASFYKNIFFKQNRSQQDNNFILKFNLNTFFDLHIFFLLKDELYLDFIDESYLNFYFKTNSISRKINCLRFIHFPLEYKKINHKH